MEFEIFNTKKETQVLRGFVNQLFNSLINYEIQNYLTEWERDHSTPQSLLEKKKIELKLKKEGINNIINEINEGNVSIEIKITK